MTAQFGGNKIRGAEDPRFFRELNIGNGVSGAEIENVAACLRKGFGKCSCPVRKDPAGGRVHNNILDMPFPEITHRQLHRLFRMDIDGGKSLFACLN